MDWFHEIVSGLAWSMGLVIGIAVLGLVHRRFFQDGDKADVDAPSSSGSNYYDRRFCLRKAIGFLGHGDDPETVVACARRFESYLMDESHVKSAARPLEVAG